MMALGEWHLLGLQDRLYEGPDHHDKPDKEQQIAQGVPSMAGRYKQPSNGYGDGVSHLTSRRVFSRYGTSPMRVGARASQYGGGVEIHGHLPTTLNPGAKVPGVTKG